MTLSCTPRVPALLLLLLPLVAGPAFTSAAPEWAAALDPPTGVGRCCINGDECNSDSHCTTDCLDPSTATAYECKNCDCYTTPGADGGHCCQANYMCVAGDTPNPGAGKCKPYCDLGPGGNVCFGHGQCNAPNSCTCDDGFDPAISCQTCKSTNFGPDCKACPTAKDAGAGVCAGHGTCDGAGTSSGTGECSCDPGWATAPNGDQCAACAQGYGPPGKCDTFECHPSCGHGNCSAPNVCTCDKGWSGSTCDVTSCTDLLPGQPQCSGHGKCINPDVCACETGFQGKACEISKAACCASDACARDNNHCNECCQYPDTDSRKCSDPSYQCKSCDCGPIDGQGEQGCCGDSYCQSGSGSQGGFDAMAALVGNRGNAHCCAVGKTGPNCDTCAKGYYGSRCLPCPGGPSNPCGGKTHGTCITTGIATGTCKCQYGWDGTGCNQCDVSKWTCKGGCGEHGTCGCPAGRSALEAIGHGAASPPAMLAMLVRATPRADGQCKCREPYAGTNCDRCKDGFWKNGDTCMPCSGCKTCDVSTGKCSGGGGSGSGSGSSTGGGGGGGGTVNTIIVVGAAGVGSVLIAGLLIYAKKNLDLGRGKSADYHARSRREPLLATEVPASPVYGNLERDTTVMMMSEDFPELPPLDSF